MIIDLHIHSKASDGKFTVQEIFKEAKNRSISFMAITDHDSISCQTQAIAEAKKAGIRYITGVELNVLSPTPSTMKAKPFRWISSATNSTPTTKRWKASLR